MLEEYLDRNDHNTMLWEMENTPEVNTEWVPNMTTINAYYNTNQNAIVIPAAILGGNFYGPDMAKEDLLAKKPTPSNQATACTSARKKESAFFDDFSMIS